MSKLSEKHERYMEAMVLKRDVEELAALNRIDKILRSKCKRKIGFVKNPKHK